MGNVTLFEYSGHQIRIVKEETGEPWFVAADICRCLGLAINKRTGKPNVTVATRNLGDDQKRKYRIDTPENPKNPWIDMMILSEDGCIKCYASQTVLMCSVLSSTYNAKFCHNM